MIEKIITQIKEKCTTAGATWKSDYLQNKKGAYGEGDTFWGITVPETRKIAREHYKEISLPQVEELLQSPVHELRLLALFFMILKYEKLKTQSEKKEIIDLYLKNSLYVNNWDLVDSSAPYLLGAYIHEYTPHEISLLTKLVQSPLLWEKRTGIVATQYFIRKNNLTPTFTLAPLLFKDEHDLIKKAVGWMLKEAGEKDKNALLTFLREHHTQMNKPTLRFACEKLTKEEKAPFTS